MNPNLSLENLYIVNSFDRPCPRLIAYKTLDNKLNYIKKELKEFNGMDISRATPLKDFGFEQVSDNPIRLKRVKSSVAKYPDGETRYWQGIEEFNIEN